MYGVWYRRLGFPKAVRLLEGDMIADVPRLRRGGPRRDADAARPDEPRRPRNQASIVRFAANMERSSISCWVGSREILAAVTDSAAPVGWCRMISPATAALGSSRAD
jgi:hypothetical protein